VAYYTDYSLEAFGPNGEEAIQFLKNKTYYNWTTDEGEHTLCDVKWYNWRGDVTAASLAYPDVTFIIDGIGEEYPDIWRAYAKNGRVEKVVATIIISAPEWVHVNLGVLMLASR